MIINRAGADHYIWGGACDGWVLTPGRDLRIIEERMPPRSSETRHIHHRSRQFFYVLEGRLTMEMDGTSLTLNPRDGIEIPPMTPHQALNDSDDPVVFLVISAPGTQGDRTELPD
jgi:mannose-6-phosphate isomerase-like protein (cupin superfamily)